MIIIQRQYQMQKYNSCQNSYVPPLFFKNGHIQSIFPALFRKVNLSYSRERISTPDNDFLDLDWCDKGHDRLAVISHGLEGCSHRAYVKGMAKALTQSGWDALAWNFRSCSQESNLKLRSYHNGVTDDLSCVIDHAKKKGRYQQIVLVGFSLGGNLSLLYLGKLSPDPMIKKAVIFSAPCDLKSSAAVLKRKENSIYMKRFLVMLHKKIKAKKQMFPELIDDDGYEKIKDFKGFDDRYTAPIHGFKDAHDYWEKCSSKPYIPNINVPTLIVSALDDPFLSRRCFPFKEAATNPNVTLHTPKSGGHVGFITFNRQNRYWSEQAAIDFLNG